MDSERGIINIYSGERNVVGKDGGFATSTLKKQRPATCKAGAVKHRKSNTFSKTTLATALKKQAHPVQQVGVESRKDSSALCDTLATLRPLSGSFGREEVSPSLIFGRSNCVSLVQTDASLNSLN